MKSIIYSVNYIVYTEQITFCTCYKITFFVHNIILCVILLYEIFEIFEMHVYTCCVNLIIIISKDLLEVYIYR